MGQISGTGLLLFQPISGFKHPRYNRQAGAACTQNGDCESLHGHLKTTIDQALLLRGNRDFENRTEYATFVRELLQQKNAGRQKRLAEELPRLEPLPSHRLESFKRVRVQVNRGSVIRVQKNVYSVYSRLIGEHVDVRVYADHLEVWYAQQRVEQLPRLRGHCKQYIGLDRKLAKC